MLEIKIVVDHNDADYLTSINPISEKDIDRIKPLILMIKNFEPFKHNRHNFPTEECVRADMGEKTPIELYGKYIDHDIIEYFQDLCPWHEYGFHTVESIEIYQVINKEVLL